MNVISINFLEQPSNGDVIGFDVDWYNGQSTTISIEFGVDVVIGATKEITASNTRDFIAIYIFNNGFPRFKYEVIGSEIILTSIYVGFTASNFVSLPFVIVVSDTSSFTIYKKINIRTPYLIEVNESGQDGSKIEVFLWNKGTTEPTIPQHTISKPKVSNSQTANYYNVSDYAKEYINPIAPILVTAPTEENTNSWCYLKVKRYKLVSGEFDLIDTLFFVCLNGFNRYQDGLNDSSIEQYKLLFNNSFKRIQVSDNYNYVNVWLETGDYFLTTSYSLHNFSVSIEGMWKIPLKNGTNELLKEDESIFSIYAENQCEPIYTPVVCSFINRFGGWEFITFFKNSIDSFSAESKDYNLNQAEIDYNIQIGKKRKFNESLKQSVKLNTGFVPEGYSELIRDLIVSDVVLLDSKPAIIKSTSFEKKTHLKDNNINYEFEFEYNYNLINDMI